MNRVSKEMIESKILNVDYFYHDLLTIAVIVLSTSNGGVFKVIGESACVDSNNYNKELGEKYAYENAYEKIWMLEGYLLANK